MFGSNEVNIENWRSVKRLVGHENGIPLLAENMLIHRRTGSQLEPRQSPARKCRLGQCHNGMERSNIRY